MPARSRGQVNTITLGRDAFMVSSLDSRCNYALLEPDPAMVLPQLSGLLTAAKNET